jgi:uncharacterized metal-binding protein
MPNGKTHDAITALLAAPTFFGTWQATDSGLLAACATAAFLFGGLMFGPDLDTQSIQYTRWGVFRFLWFPYKVVFAHRSRWSHGLVFGTMIRVIYFAGAMTLLLVLVFYFAALLRHATPPNLIQIRETWENFGLWTRQNIGDYAILTVFSGLWWGAASHTLTDIAGTFIKTGKVKEFL